MSKPTIEKVNLPGRDVYRVMDGGRCLKIIGDGQGYTPQEFMRMNTMIEPTRDPVIPLPVAMQSALDDVRAKSAEADALFDKATARFWKCHDAVSRERRVPWPRDGAGNSHKSDALLRAEDALSWVESDLREAEAIKRESGSRFRALMKRAEDWRGIEKLRLDREANETHRPVGLLARAAALARKLNPQPAA